MAFLSVIRRWHFRDGLSIREIARRTGLSRNTIRKYLRADTVEPKFHVPDRPSKIDPFAGKLSAWLKSESRKPRKQKRTVKQIHADLVTMGYQGSYGRVAAFARRWKEERQREQNTAGRDVFVPLVFEPGEVFQFDWSEDWALIGGERVKLQVAHTKLCYSRAFIVRAYLLQTHEMLFDAHNHAFRVLGGVRRRTPVAWLGEGSFRAQPTRRRGQSLPTPSCISSRMGGPVPQLAWQIPPTIGFDGRFCRRPAGRRARPCCHPAASGRRTGKVQP